MLYLLDYILNEVKFLMLRSHILVRVFIFVNFSEKYIFCEISSSYGHHIALFNAFKHDFEIKAARVAHI